MAVSTLKSAGHAARHHSHPVQKNRSRTRRATTSGSRARTPRRIHTKRSAAARFFPAPTATTSMRYLRRAIKGDPELEEKLRKAGYRPRLRYLTERQMRILTYYIG